MGRKVIIVGIVVQVCSLHVSCYLMQMVEFQINQHVLFFAFSL